GPDTVENIDNLKVVVTVVNIGDEALKLLTDPNGPLSTIPTDTFTITDATGNTPTFVGVKAKYVPSVAAQKGAFTTLAPGESKSVQHDLADAYNFTATGPGKYEFAANNMFYHVGDAGTVEDIIYASHADAHMIALSGRLARARPSQTLVKRASYNGCSTSEKSSLAQAAPAAQTYVANAMSYLQAHTSSTTRFTTWFGTYLSSHHSTVLTHYTNMNGNVYTSYSFDCTCTDSGTYAYVYPDEYGTVYLCGAFWSAPVTGTDSMGGTLVHESSHFTANAGTQDYVYGQSSSKSLAKSNSGEAIMNADSHEYFAENNPVQS
ncbi:hypothetical protein JAAARDRAFT_118985, partial [Jaapia argillacea MUCL 33604]